MKKKRSYTLVLTVVLLFVLSSVSFGAYLDTQGHAAGEAIDRWSERSIIFGYENYFRPDDPITRGEMALIIDRIVQYQHAAENSFTDLEESWYTQAVLKANAAGVILGYDGLVRPLDNISRAEAVIMLARTFFIPEKADGLYAFTDAAAIPDWAAGFAGALAQKNVLPFIGHFAPEQDITRAEVVQILDGLLAELIQAPGGYAREFYGSVVISATGVSLDGSTVHGDLFIAGSAEGIDLAAVTVLGTVYDLKSGKVLKLDAPQASSPSATETSFEELDLWHNSQDTVNVIVRAGRSLAQIFTLLEDRGVCSTDALFAASNRNFSALYPVLTSAYQAQNRLFPLEGYIIPGTYTFYLDSSPDLILKTFLDATQTAYEPYAAAAQELGYTLDEVITIASIVEKEVGGCTDHDRKTVASVIYNRLDTEMKLQMNVTENYLDTYVLPYAPAVQEEDYEQYYNTYITKGLPAGAICSPRPECIEAALSPYASDYIFFRSDSFGNIYYAVTYEMHLENGIIAENAIQYLGYLGGLAQDEPEPEYTPVPGRYNGYTIMLDAGHGGTDPGADAGSVYEKDINLTVTLKLRDVLRAQGMDVLMIRSDDRALSVEQRVELTNEAAPDLFLSIHCNAVENRSDVSGIETYYYPEDLVSKQWAGYVQSALISATDALDRGVKPKELYVLHHAQMPAILAELGFMTNNTDLALLQDTDYQDLLVEALAAGVFAYLDQLIQA